jgi:hypothetical protein
MKNDDLGIKNGSSFKVTISGDALAAQIILYSEILILNYHGC